MDEYGRIFDLKYNPADNIDLAYYREGYFKTFEDFENFPPLDPDSKRREKYFKGMKKAQDQLNGKVYCIPTIWGIYESSWQCIGFTNFCKMLRQPEKIKAIIDSRGDFSVKLAQKFIEWGENNIIQLYDDLGYKTGLQINPKFLKKYLFPWYEKLCEVAHQSGVKVFLHSCGDIYEVFDDLIKAGFDGIHPIEPTTANPEYDIFKLNQKFGDKVTFIGNVSPQDLADKDPEFIQNYVKKLLKNVALGGGFILSSGHSINPAVKWENFKAMRETLEDFGTYPINIS